MVILAFGLFAKAFGTQYTDWGNAALLTSDGKFLAIGGSGLTGGDGAAVLLDAEGNAVWVKNYSASEYQEFWGAAEVSDGFVLVGISGDYDQDIIVVKVGTDGSVKWAKYLEGGDVDNGYGVAPSPDGGVLVVGESYSFSGDPSHSDAVVLKLDAGGNLQWAKVFRHPDDTIDECFYDVVPLSDGYLLAGNVGINYGDGLLVKLDLDGNLVWAKTLGGGMYDDLRGIAPAEGGFGLYGLTDSYGDFGSVWMLKVAEDGTPQWGTAFTGTWYTLHEGRPIAYSGGSFYAIARDGIQVGQIVLLKVSSSGSLEWAKGFGDNNDDWAGGVAPSPDGGVFFTGESWGFGYGNGDFDVVLLGPDGNYPNCYFSDYSPSITTASPSASSISLQVEEVSPQWADFALSTGGSLGETEICPSSSAEECAGLSELKAYPVRGGLVFVATKPTHLKLYDPSGRVAASLRLPAGKSFVPLKPGVYLWRGGKAMVN